jgi:AraC-like DNA-binding protein
MKFQKLFLEENLDGDIWLYEKHRNNTNFGEEHIHEELEVNIVISGTANYLISGKRYQLTPGIQVWLFPKHPHVLLETSKDFKMWVVVFKKTMIKRLVDDGAERVLSAELFNEDFVKENNSLESHELSDLCKQTIGVKDNVALRNAAIAYLCLKSWDLFKNGSRPEEYVSISKNIQKAISMIEHSSYISMQEMCLELSINPSKLSREFKNQLGLTMSDYRQKIYLDRFMSKWNQNKKINLLKSALDSGFGSYAQFHRVFKKNLGVGPAVYKRTFMKEN